MTKDSISLSHAANHLYELAETLATRPAFKFSVTSVLVEEARGRGVAEYKERATAEELISARAAVVDLHTKLDQRTTENEKLTQVLEAKNAELDRMTSMVVEAEKTVTKLQAQFDKVDVLLRLHPRGKIGDRDHAMTRIAVYLERLKELRLEDEITF